MSGGEILLSPSQPKGLNIAFPYKPISQRKYETIKNKKIKNYELAN